MHFAIVSGYSWSGVKLLYTWVYADQASRDQVSELCANHREKRKGQTEVTHCQVEVLFNAISADDGWNYIYIAVSNNYSALSTL